VTGDVYQRTGTSKIRKFFFTNWASFFSTNVIFDVSLSCIASNLNIIERSNQLRVILESY